MIRRRYGVDLPSERALYEEMYPSRYANIIAAGVVAVSETPRGCLDLDPASLLYIESDRKLC